MHDWGKGVWTETIAGTLREGKEYARFEVQPGIEVRIRYIDGELIAETRSCGEVYLIKSTPPPWQYHRGWEPHAHLRHPSDPRRQVVDG